MRNKWMLILSVGSIAVLGACNRNVQMEAGEWEVTSSISKINVPGAPPEMVEQMTKQKETSSTCLSDEDVSNPIEKILKRGQSQNCTGQDMKMEGGNVSGRMTCRGPGGQGEMTTEFSGEYDDDSLNMEMSSVAQTPEAPGQKMEMTVRMEGRRTGDCAAPAAKT